MLLLKLLQSLVKALHSEGTPGQVAAGIALGSILGLTPLVNLHNALVFGLIIILNVSFPGARVEMDRLHLGRLAGKVEVRGLTAASPFEPLKNLFQADELVADVDVAPLLERKVIVDRLAAKGLRFGTPRATSGIVSSAEP